MCEQRNPHLSQVESHKQDSSDIPIKSYPGAINRDIGMAKGLVRCAQSIVPKRDIHLSEYINAEVGWRPIMLKSHAVANGNQNILKQI